MLMMLNARCSAGFASMSTFTTSTEPSYFSASRASSGATMRHGPHHSAQKSTTTGRSAFSTSSSNVASVTCLISTMGTGSLSPAVDAVSVALPGKALDEPIGLEHAHVREAVVDRAALPPALDETGTPQHGKVLAHVRHLAAHRDRQVAHRELPAGQRFEHAEPLRIGQRPPDRRIALAVEVGRGRDGGVQHRAQSCQYLRKHASTFRPRSGEESSAILGAWTPPTAS